MTKNPRECGTFVLLISLLLLFAVGPLLSLTLGPVPLRALALAWILLVAVASTGRSRHVAAVQLAAVAPILVVITVPNPVTLRAGLASTAMLLLVADLRMIFNVFRHHRVTGATIAGAVSAEGVTHLRLSHRRDP